eukprot:gene25890-biopygen11355
MLLWIGSEPTSDLVPSATKKVSVPTRTRNSEPPCGTPGTVPPSPKVGGYLEVWASRSVRVCKWGYGDGQEGAGRAEGREEGGDEGGERCVRATALKEPAEWNDAR